MSLTSPFRTRFVSLLFTVTLAVLCILLWLRVFQKSRPVPDAPQIIARVGNMVMTAQDLSPEDQNALAAIEIQKGLFLKQRAIEWIEAQLILRESLRQNTIPNEIKKRHLDAPAAVSRQEAYARYTLSPSADQYPFEKALQLIANEMEYEKREEARVKLMKELLSKAPRVESPYVDITELTQVRPVPGSTFVPFSASTPREIQKRGQLEHPPFRGPANAPMVLEIFSDFMCPFSARFAKTVEELEKRYPDQIRVEFRHFPLAFHKGADRMAQASVCAQSQGMFWEYHDRLFLNPRGTSDEDLLGHARALNLNLGAFQSCLSNQEIASKVAADMAEGKTRGVRGTPGSFLNGRNIQGAQPLQSLVPLVEWTLDPKGPYPGASAKPSQKRAPQPAAPQAPSVPPPSRIVKWESKDLAGSPTLGPDHAPITMVEFVDFNCPFCQKGNNTLQELVKRYGENLRIVQKQLPLLTIHPTAGQAAQAALCAHAQGKYWEYRGALFSTHWGKRDEAALRDIAQKVNLDEASFGTCLETGQTKSAVETDLALAQKNGIRGTPTYFMNGREMSGAQPLQNFTSVIDSLLEAAE